VLNSGPLSPGTLASDNTIGDVAWTNPSNAASSNDADATATIDQNSTEYLKCTNFGAAVPEGATIVGVEIAVECAAEDGDDSLRAKLVVAGAVAGSELDGGGSVQHVTDATETLGGDDDMGGLTLTPAQVNASTFGAVVWIDTVAGSNTVTIDHVTLTIYYIIEADPMTLSVTREVNMTLVETFGDPSLGSDNTLTHSAFNHAVNQLNGSTTPTVVTGSYDEITLSSGSATINLADAPHIGNTSVDHTGNKPIGVIFKAPATNAAIITIAKGASNGYTGFGSSFSMQINPGQTIAIPFGSSTIGTVAVASNNRTLDLAGTGTDKLAMGLVFGTLV
jgi:hypothetical protein